MGKTCSVKPILITETELSFKDFEAIKTHKVLKVSHGFERAFK
jgi:hypothetical protein